MASVPRWAARQVEMSFQKSPSTTVRPPVPCMLVGPWQAYWDLSF